MSNSKKNMLLKGLCFAAFSTACFAQAESLEFIFNQKDGFQSAEKCSVRAANDISLRILQDANPPKDLRALIKVEGNSSAFKLVSVSQDQDNAKNRERLSAVELNETSGRDLADFVLEITGKTSTKIGSSGIALQDSHFQVSTEGEKYVLFTCGQKEFVAFDVFVANNMDPVARVGVSTDDLSIFKTVQIRTADEAETALTEKEKKQSSQGQLQDITVHAGFRSASLGSGIGDLMKMQKSGQSIDSKKMATRIANVPVFEGEPDQVVCGTSAINVQSDDLSKSVFQLNSGDQIQVVQSFGPSTKDLTVNGQVKTFVQVRALNRKDGGVNTGWVEESSVKHRSQCAQAEQQKEILLYDITEAAAKDGASKASSGIFPTNKRPSDSYKTGMRRFKAGRAKGRLHAACDLYRTKNEAAVAVMDGTVIRGLRAFYEGTYSLELRLKDGRIMRYGEMTGKAAKGSKEGKSVKKGTEMGYIGKVNSGCCTPMLHFEMYKGTSKGNLSVKGKGANKFGRRTDLFDGTSQLTTWEKSTFGKSY